MQVWLEQYRDLTSKGGGMTRRDIHWSFSGTVWYIWVPYWKYSFISKYEPLQVKGIERCHWFTEEEEFKKTL